MNAINYFETYFDTIDQKIRSVDTALLAQAAQLILATHRNGRKLIIVGNGGSAVMASHVSVDFTHAAGIRAINFNEPDLITCLANDHGYEHWVDKSLRFYADPGDLAIVISSGGRSPNMLNAAHRAREMGLGIITLSGFIADNPLRQLGDINLWVDSNAYNIVEMTHHTWLLALVDHLIAIRDNTEMTRAHEIAGLLLAAGLGSRLRPLTDDWPKCLMPIGERPLLEYWLETLHRAKIRHVLVNLHHHADQVAAFLDRTRFADWVTRVYEPQLLGTAGTLCANAPFFRGRTILLVHADNWCQCDFTAFLAYHRHQRPPHSALTMMTFDTQTPQTCGIVETDRDGLVLAFHEKAQNPPGHRANAAVYLLEPEVLDWIIQHPTVSDFSTEVLPHFIGRIATWHNAHIHRDIGTLPALLQAQVDPRPPSYWPSHDAWQAWFSAHPVRHAIQPSRQDANTETTP
jgi:mannose-1-phosphate guanylyltransferase